MVTAKNMVFWTVCCVVRRQSDVSEEYITSFFMVEGQKAKMSQLGSDPEDGDLPKRRTLSELHVVAVHW
jgi:hypothetical protein